MIRRYQHQARAEPLNTNEPLPMLLSQWEPRSDAVLRRLRLYRAAAYERPTHDGFLVVYPVPGLFPQQLDSIPRKGRRQQPQATAFLDPLAAAESAPPLSWSPTFPDSTEPKPFHIATYERASSGAYLVSYPTPELSWWPSPAVVFQRRRPQQPPSYFDPQIQQGAAPPAPDGWDAQDSYLPRKSREPDRSFFADPQMPSAAPPPVTFWEPQFFFQPRRRPGRAPYETAFTDSYLVSYQTPFGWDSQSDYFPRRIDAPDQSFFADPQAPIAPPPPVTFWEPGFEFAPRRRKGRAQYESVSSHTLLISYPAPQFTWLPTFQEYRRPPKRIADANQFVDPIGMFTSIPFAAIFDVEYEPLPMMKVDYQPSPMIGVEYEPAPVFDVDVV